MSRHQARTLPALEAILSKLRESLPDLRRDYGVAELGVFGSYVRGQARQRSDLDLLVDFERTPTLFEIVRLERHLTGLLGIKVDLVMKAGLRPAIGDRILAEVVPVEA